MNKVMMSCRLTRDAEVRYTAAGRAVAVFDFAVNRRFKRDNEPDADFFHGICFGKTAELFGRYIFKGTKIIIEGEVRNNNYTDQQGQKHYGTQIVVDSVEFCESKNTQPAGQFTQANAMPPDQWTQQDLAYTPPAEQMALTPGGFTPVDADMHLDEDLPF